MLVEGQLIGGSISESMFEIFEIGSRKIISGTTDPDLLKGVKFGALVTATIEEHKGKYILVNLVTY